MTNIGFGKCSCRNRDNNFAKRRHGMLILLMIIYIGLSYNPHTLRILCRLPGSQIQGVDIVISIFRIRLSMMIIMITILLALKKIIQKLKKGNIRLGQVDLLIGSLVTENLWSLLCTNNCSQQYMYPAVFACILI